MSSRGNGNSASALAVLGLLVIVIASAHGEYESNGMEKVVSRSLDGSGNALCTGPNCAERGGGLSGAMWFGPRLGRRRRSDEKTAEGFDENQINAIAEAIEASPWNLFSLQNSNEKRHTNQFTPRLGRESGEELLHKYLLMGDAARFARLIDAQDDLEERQSPPAPPPPPPFAPRLGRHLALPAPSPTLGRRLRTLLQKL